MEKKERKERKEDKDSMDFSTPKGCIEALEDCLERKESLLEENIAQREYFITGWTAIVSLCAQSIRSEMGDMLKDYEKERIKTFLEESNKDPVDLVRGEKFINETIELLEDMASIDAVSDGVAS